MSFYQGRKMGEKNKEIKKHPRGRNWAKTHRECPQDRKAQALSSRSFNNLPRRKGACRELEQDPRRGRDALRLPGALTEELRPGGEPTTPRSRAP